MTTQRRRRVLLAERAFRRLIENYCWWNNKPVFKRQRRDYARHLNYLVRLAKGGR